MVWEPGSNLSLYTLTLLHLCKVVCEKGLYNNAQGDGTLWWLLLLVLMSLFPLLVTSFGQNTLLLPPPFPPLVLLF